VNRVPAWFPRQVLWFTWTLLVLIAAWLIDVEFLLPGPRVNISSSVPVGLYWFTPQHEVTKGTIAVVCFDGWAEQFMRRVSDLGAGPCPSGIAPAAKVIAAVPGDAVSFSREGVRVNGGDLWPMSRPLAQYGPQPERTITLARRQVLLMGLNRYSADGRYLGSIDDHVIIGSWRPLLVF
jgi:conjugative transfer signal peptidase TraF